MKKLLATVALAGMLGAISVSAYDASQITRTEGPALQAYMLSPAEDTCFYVGDHVKSKFWEAWTLDPTLAVAVLADAQVSRGTPLSGPGDAKITLQCAYGAKGAYFLFSVDDDDFITNVGGIDYENDAVELYLSDMSSAAMYANPTAAFTDVNFRQMGQGTCQFQIRFGGANPEAITSFNWNYYDEYLTSLTLNNKVTILTAADQYKIKVELMKTNSEGVRQQEWFIPWTAMGGIVVDRAGKRVPKGNAITEKLGLTFGYNDVDGAEAATALRWRNQADPFTIATIVGTTSTTIDTWGDIEFLEAAQSLDAKLAAKGIAADVISALANCPNSIKYVGNRASTLNSKVVKTNFYTLSGKKLAMVNGMISVPKNTVYVERHVLANGATKSFIVSNR